MKRYDPIHPARAMREIDSGEYVRYDDAQAALQEKDTEIARLQNELRDAESKYFELGCQLAELEEQNSRLAAVACIHPETIDGAINRDCTVCGLDLLQTRFKERGERMEAMRMALQFYSHPIVLHFDDWFDAEGKAK